jgi:hypothetical protein
MFSSPFFELYQQAAGAQRPALRRKSNGLPSPQRGRLSAGRFLYSIDLRDSDIEAPQPVILSCQGAAQADRSDPTDGQHAPSKNLRTVSIVGIVPDRQPWLTAHIAQRSLRHASSI